MGRTSTLEIVGDRETAKLFGVALPFLFETRLKEEPGDPIVTYNSSFRLTKAGPIPMANELSYLSTTGKKVVYRPEDFTSNVVPDQPKSSPIGSTVRQA